ncbi:hypothetical protein A2164_02695 [Candidatus Curtissbacteria bacterium RBG_13_35_7]|uniref:PIN domain-containing protein n=1 Tax=Candidatus Curtissbacteria bacterium RBG_13_35_7 TaxID=1797705 RepID=A0A1F5G4F5_9BACT|nr:MAG: hypothetical protein A2164_02695 [Candidatus Curtissbacteria bacterium RBG_13_35_7]
MSKKVNIILSNTEQVKFVSIVTFWDISLKFSLGKIYLKGIQPDKLPNTAKDSQFEILNITPEIASSYHKLPKSHLKDPYDRMIAWQAIKEKFTLITKDKAFDNFQDCGLKVLW